MRQLTKEQKEDFKDILETLGEALDITQTQYDNLTKSYKAVGEFLEKDPRLLHISRSLLHRGRLG